MDSNFLLGKLPAYKNNFVLIEKKQSVHDIVKEVLQAHRIFASDYDSIAEYFWTGDIDTTCKKIFRFCKENINYRIEEEGKQTTKSPAAILEQGFGDCKHYAGFIGGILDAIQRKYNIKIDWRYRFAAYSGMSSEPEHVFVVVKSGNKIFWVDPVLKNFDERLQPLTFIDKKGKAMLMRVSGIGNNNYIVTDVLDNIDYSTQPGLYHAIQTLLKYGIMGMDAKISERQMKKFITDAEITEAYNTVRQAAIGSLFGDIWRGVKKVTMAAPRGAYLSLVAVNGFGMATKLKAAVYKADGTYTSFKEKIKGIWQDTFGGDWTKLENTINQGSTHKAILGEVITLAAWTAAATAIIKVMQPIIHDALLKGQQTGEIPFGNYNVDPMTGLPYGNASGSGNIMAWIQANPMIVLGGVAAYLYLSKKKTA